MQRSRVEPAGIRTDRRGATSVPTRTVRTDRILTPASEKIQRMKELQMTSHCLDLCACLQLGSFDTCRTNGSRCDAILIVSGSTRFSSALLQSLLPIDFSISYRFSYFCLISWHIVVKWQLPQMRKRNLHKSIIMGRKIGFWIGEHYCQWIQSRPILLK